MKTYEFEECPDRGMEEGDAPCVGNIPVDQYNTSNVRSQVLLSIRNISLLKNIVLTLIPSMQPEIPMLQLE